MIVNLIGLPASGKSTFARWFTPRHPGTLYLAIDEVRKYFDSTFPESDVLQKELAAWEFINAQIIDNEPPTPRFIILESTGLSPGIEQLWSNEKIGRPVYTVKLIVSQDTLLARAQQRATVDDDTCAIFLEAESFSLLPSNLAVTSDSLDIYSYRTIEMKILAAELHHMWNNLKPIQEEQWK